MKFIAFKNAPWEAMIWITGLTVLAVLPAGEAHFSICPFDAAGLDFCPGCGLGRSIGYLFRGDIKQSFGAHPLGVFAVIILTSRIIQLAKLYHKSYGQSN
jgi:hypothetical protein